MCGFATAQVARQREQFMRLGILGRWFNPCYFNTRLKRQIRLFAKMVGTRFNLVVKPITEISSSESALAEAELNHEVTSDSIYVAFPLVNVVGELKDAKLIIWTTTPWTLPANLATSVHQIRICFNFMQNKYIVAKSIKDLTEILSFENVKILKTS